MIERVQLSVIHRAEHEAALEPAGVVALGARDVAALLRALLQLDEVALRTMRGVTSSSSQSLAIVLGASDALPWFDGVRYLGEAAPGLFVPTTRALSVKAPLAAAALARHLPAAVVDVDNRCELVPLREALPLSRASLLRRSRIVT